jgi:hypothetical protein
MLYHVSRGVAIGTAVTLLLVVLLGAALFSAMMWHYAHSPFPDSPPIQAENVQWRTGDVVLTKSADDTKFKGFCTKRLPSHAALMWVHPEHGPCIIETSPENTQLKEPPLCAMTGQRTVTGTRVTRLDDYVRASPTDRIYRRAYLGATITDSQMDAAVRAALHTPFEPMLVNIQPMFLIGIISTSLWPSASKPLFALTPRPSTPSVSSVSSAPSAPSVPSVPSLPARSKTVFCSELVVQILQDVGVVHSHVSPTMSPLALSSYGQRLDTVATNGATWASEEHVVFPHTTFHV